MPATERLVSINLPVRDLEASTAFFATLGFAFDPRFCDRSAACMVVSDKAHVMLLPSDRFGGLAAKPVGDATTTTAAIYALSATDRESVDAFADAALAAGATAANEPVDLGVMYGRSFFDLDGHAWEVVWMDRAAVEQDPAAPEETAA